MPVNLNVRDRLCVLVGGGRVARRKCRTLLDCGARVRVVSPELIDDGVWASPGIEWLRQPYESSVLQGCFLAIAATNDPAVNEQVERDARAVSALLLRADDGSRGDLTFPAVLRHGALSLAFSTDGSSPALAAALKRNAEELFQPAFARLCEQLQTPDPARGRVYLVGAGPGDPGLITVKGAACLRAADVVVHDALVDLSLIDLYCSNAERIDVSKRKGCCRHLQPEINAILVEQARQGKTVVRLKGGDPMIFGRGGEESRALAAAGIDYEVVPGVSSITAVPAYAGIPVTDREYGASPLGVYSLHRRGGAELSADDWHRMAQSAGTLVLLMGKTLLPRVVEELLRNGRAPSTPIALIVDGTTKRQRNVFGTLETILSRVDVASLDGPGLIVVGEVVRAAGHELPAPSAEPSRSDNAEPIDVILVRHAEIAERYRGCYIGCTDVPLGALGRAHADALRQRLDLALPGLRLCSPLARAVETARAASNGKGYRIDDDLREIDFGRWEGLRFDEIVQSDPDAVARWARLESSFAFPDGESLAGFEQRVARVAQRVAESDERRVYLYTHGGVIRALLSRWLGLGVASQLLFDARPASVTRVRLHGPGGVLVGFNDLCHIGQEVAAWVK